MWTLIKIAWRSLWRHKVRTIISVSAIAFGLGLAVFFIAFADGVYAKLIEDAVRMQAGHFTVEHVEYRDAPAIDLVVDNADQVRRELEGLQGVERTKLLVFGQGVAKSSSGAVGIGIFGIEPSAEMAASPLPRKLVEGEYLSDSDFRKIVIGKKLADRLKVAVGKKVVISTNNAQGDLVDELVRVKGVFRMGAEEIDGFLVQVPLAFSQRLFGLSKDQVTQVGALLKHPEDRDDILAAARTRLPAANIAIWPWEKILPDLAAYIRLDGGSNYVFQGIIIFLSLFTIFNTIVMSVLERRREFAMVMALGTAPRTLQLQVVVESFFLALVGTVVGLELGVAVAYPMQVYGLDLSTLYPDGLSVSGFSVDSIIYAKITTSMLVTLGSIIFTATIAMALVAVRRIPRIEIAQSLR